MRASEILQPPHIFAGLLYRGYRAIAIDAPTHFKCHTALQVANWSSRRDVEKHYRTMPFEQHAALPLRDDAERWHKIASYCQQNPKRGFLYEREFGFLEGMVEQTADGDVPSEAQQAWLLKIYRRLGGANL
jgi:hypothetical protein